MSIGAIVQSRSSSTRFPRKIFQNFDGNETVLSFLLKTLQSIFGLEKIIIAVPENQKSEFSHLESPENRIYVECGDEDNVLQRFYNVAKKHDLQTVVRITSDCPLIIKEMVDQMIQEFSAGDYDYLTNYSLKGVTEECPDDYASETLTPDGFCIEIFNFTSLEEAFQNAEKKYDLEHVTPWIKRKKKTKIIDTGKFLISGKFSIDTPADLENAKTLKRWMDEGKISIIL